MAVDGPQSQFNQQGQNNYGQQTNVAGDLHQHFHGDLEPVKSVIMSFKTLMDNKLRHFVGRQFVFDAIDEFIKNNSSGYFIIRAAPGMGKSSLMAKLIREREYIHHFNIVTDHIVSPRDFLRNVCAQLIVKYRLPYDSLPSDAGKNNTFLKELLETLAAESKNHPIVLAIDSLDESDRTRLEGANILYLPSSLPNGVYIIATTRPLSNDEMRLQVSSTKKQFDLEPNSKFNSGDIDAYTSNFISRTANMPEWLEKHKLAQDRFINGIRFKSQGNFMYLHHVLPAIAEGRLKLREKDVLDELPDGLLDFYYRHWSEMRVGKKEKFEEIYAPIVAFLGEAKEPVTTKHIADWTKLKPFTVEASIGEWREFLIEEKKGASHLFRIYHKSFQDFLHKQVPPEYVNEAISDSYLSKVTHDRG